MTTTSTALAIRSDQNNFDDYQRAVLKQLGIGDDVHNAELASYLHICQRTGLDPFSGQIHLIGRFDKRAGRTVYRPQTGIDGYRVIAQRTCERTSGTLGYGDTQWCGPDGQWTDCWLQAGAPKAAKVLVFRNGQPFPAVAHYGEYVPTDRDGKPMGLWSRMAAGQLAKCAEALALRKAFPNDIAGVYTAEEMEQADTDARPHLTAVQQHDAERDAAGLMTTHQRVEHAALRRMNEPAPGAVEKVKETDPGDIWYQDPPGPDPETPDRKHPTATSPGHPHSKNSTPLFATLGLDETEQDTIIAWLARGEWTASNVQIKDITGPLTDFLKATGGDVAATREAMWNQYRTATSSE